MAELVDQLRLEIDQALRQIDEVGRALDRAFASVELRIDPTSVDSVRRSADQITQAFDLAETEARSLDRATSDVDRNLAEAEQEARGFERALERADSEARDLDVSTGRVAGSFTALRGSIVGLAAGFGAFAAIRGIVRGLDDLINSFVAFDQAINESLAIVSNVTPELRAQFEDVARTVSTTLRFSAAEAGEAFFFLASAGFDATQQLALLPQVAQFAQAGMFDLSTATSLLADSQSALGLRTKDATQAQQSLTRVADVLTKANILSNASVQQFAEALTNDAAAAARLVGVEVEETVAVLAVFADQGTKGAAAGTAFAIVLRDLQRAALDQPGAFEDLGVSVFDATGEFRPFADIIGELELALDGMSDAQIRATVTALGFQDRSVQNLLTLLGTSEAIRTYTVGLQDAAGATEDLANKQLLSLGARLDIAKQKFEDAKITLGEQLVPAVEAFVAILPDVIAAAERLAPAIAAVAAAFGEAAPGAAAFVEQILRFVEAVPRSAGIAGELGSIATVPLQTTILSLETIGDLLLGNFGEVGQDIDDIVTGITGIGDSIDNIQFSRLEQGLQDSIREGRDAVSALGDALIKLDEGEGGATFANIARLARTAGVEGKTLNLVLRALITDAVRLGLSVDQVRDFGSVLLESTTTARELAARAAVAVAELPLPIEAAADRIVAAQEPITAFFQEVETVIGESGVSIAEFVLFGGEVTESLLNMLTPADRLSVVFDAIGSDAEAAAGAFADSLTPTIRDAQTALIDFNESGQVSLSEFIRGLEETFTATLAFQRNLAAVLEVSPDLFDFLANLPDQAQAALLAQEAVSSGRIEETAAALLGDPEELAAFFQDIVNQAVGIFRSEGPAGVEEFGLGLAELVPDDVLRTRLLTEIESGIEALRDDIGFQLERAFTQDDAVNRAAGITADAYDQEIIRRVGLLGEGTDIFDLIEAGLTQEDAARLGATTTAAAYVAGLVEDLQANVTAAAGPISDLFDIDLTTLGAEARSTYFDGLTTPSESETTRLRRSITEIINEATFRGSPPKLFLDFGEEAGDAYWSGFEQADQLDSFNISLDTAQFGALGVSAGQSYTQGISDAIRRFDEGYNPGDFGFTQGITDEIRRFDEGYNPGDYGFMSDQEIRFDFNLRDFHEKLATALETGNVADVGLGVRDSFVTGLSTPGEGESARLRASIVALMDAATDSHSPSQLFLGLGVAAGDAFWSGFEQAQLNLRVPAPPITGSIAGSTVAGSTAGGVNVNLNINNPSVNDAVSDAARLGQIASSIATTYRSVT